MVLGHDSVQAVVPYAEVEGGLLDDPLVLRVEAKTVGVFDHLERRRPDGDRLRHAVPEGIRPRTRDLVQVVVVALPPEVILLQEVPELEAVRAGNVRRGEPAVVFVDEAARVAARPDVVVRIGAVHDVQREIRHANVIRSDDRAIPLQVVLPSRVFVQHVLRESCFQQQPVRHRITPADERQVLRVVHVQAARLGRRLHGIDAAHAGEAERAAAVVLNREGHDELLLLRRLPCQSRAVVLEELVVARDSSQIGFVEQRALELVEVAALNIARGAPPSVRREEPQFVSNDRPSHRAAVVVRMPDGNVGVQPARAKIVVQVAALQRRTGVRHVQASREPVAAVLLDDVDLHAAAYRLGGHAARLDDHFLE